MEIVTGSQNENNFICAISSFRFVFIIIFLYFVLLIFFIVLVVNIVVVVVAVAVKHQHQREKEIQQFDVEELISHFHFFSIFIINLPCSQHQHHRFPYDILIFLDVSFVGLRMRVCVSCVREFSNRLMAKRTGLK